MGRSSTEAEILVLSGNILTGRATEEEIKRITKMAVINNCQNILKRVLKNTQNALKGK